MRIVSENYFDHKTEQCGYEVGVIENFNDFNINQPFIYVGNHISKETNTVWCDNNHQNYEPIKNNIYPGKDYFILGFWKVKCKK